MVITLTPDIESALTQQASQQGTTPELLALDSLRQQFVPAPETQPIREEKGTLADYLAAHIGVLRSGEHVPGGAQMSENTGEKFAAGMLRKRRQRRL